MDIKLPIITQFIATEKLKDSTPVAPVTRVEPVTDIIAHNLSASETQRESIMAALRQLIPQLASPTRELLQILQNLPNLGQSNQLPEDLKTILQHFIQTVPQATSLSNPQFLAQTLQNAGLFLEKKLSQPSTNATEDLQQNFKVILLKLITTLNLHLHNPSIADTFAPEVLTWLTALQQKSATALSNLILDQLASVPKEDSPKQVWYLEIPYLAAQNPDTLKLEVERDARSVTENNPDPAWSVTITLTPPKLGTLYCKISYIEGTLNTYFRSEDAQTLKLIDANIEHLRAQFEAAGLKPGHLDSQKGHLQKNLALKFDCQHLFQDQA